MPMVRYQFKGFSLSLKGHVGNAPRGKDLVCAAVTGIVYALTAYVKELEEAGMLVCKPEIRLEPGDAKIAALPIREALAPLTGAFDMAEAGLMLLEEQYPEGVGRCEIEDRR